MKKCKVSGKLVVMPACYSVVMCCSMVGSENPPYPHSTYGYGKEAQTAYALRGCTATEGHETNEYKTVVAMLGNLYMRSGLEPIHLQKAANLFIDIFFKGHSGMHAIKRDLTIASKLLYTRFSEFNSLISRVRLIENNGKYRLVEIYEMPLPAPKNPFTIAGMLN